MWECSVANSFIISLQVSLIYDVVLQTLEPRTMYVCSDFLKDVPSPHDFRGKLENTIHVHP